MNNLEMINHIQALPSNIIFQADEIVKEGHGQNRGGYIDSQGREASQKEHFLHYYKDKEKVTYAYLRCPQLIIFIAEIAGAKEIWLSNAIAILKRYDAAYDKVNASARNGNYFWGKPEFREFKNALHFQNICMWIKRYETLQQVIEQINLEED